MKYTKEIVDKMVERYQTGTTAEELAQELDVPVRSIIAKLSSLGVYKKKSYTNKNGEVPVKKEFYIERIAHLLNENIELLESLEKVNKRVLIRLVEQLESVTVDAV
jgi:Zn-dependent peptidase ImmA (M78 family)